MIKKLSLKNFKCFENIDIALNEVNVLTGINGMGKSSIIQSILLLQQSSRDQVFPKGLKLNGSYVKLGNGQDLLFEKATEDMIAISIENEKKRYDFQFQYMPESDLLPVQENSCLPDAMKELCPELIYLSADRIAPQAMYGVINEDDLKARRFGNSGEYAIQYLNAVKDETVTLVKLLLKDRKGDIPNTVSGQVQLWMDMIAPGVVPQIKVDMQRREAELKYEFVEGREKSNSYKSINVGFGITYILPVVIALVSAKKGDIILMENPEAHLHPAGQRRMGELISIVAAQGVQIIVETHSDHILNGVRVSVKQGKIEPEKVNLLYFYKDQEDDFRHKSVNPVIDRNGRIDEWPVGFFDEWDNALLELL